MAEEDESVGLSVRDGRLQIRLPKVYRVHLRTLQTSRSKAFRAVGLLLRVLTAYARAWREAPAGDSLREIPVEGQPLGIPEAQDGIAAAILLLEEYLERGLYLHKRSVVGEGLTQGTTDWSRTLRRSTPVIVGSTPVYWTSVQRQRTVDRSDLLHRLHASVLDEVSRIFGHDVEIPASSLLQSSTYEELSSVGHSALAGLRSKTFTDRGLALIDLIERYLFFRQTLVQRGGAADILIGVTDFEYVWEEMLRTLLANNPGMRASSLPSGIWGDLRKGQDESGVKPRVDFARAGAQGRDGVYEYLILFDAKDKEVETPSGRSASEPDIYKQMHYWRLVRQADFRATLNALVFPAHSDAFAVLLKPLGGHRWRELPDPPVYELAADYETVCRAFVGEIRLDAEAEVARLLHELWG